MASARWQIGTAYTRTCNALKLGLIPLHQRPVWLEAYAHTPPLDNPVYTEKNVVFEDIRFAKANLLDQKIIYEEDKHRAVFQQYYGNGGQIYNFLERLDSNENDSNGAKSSSHPVANLAREVRELHRKNALTEENTEQEGLQSDKLEGLEEVIARVEEHAPEDNDKVNFIQDLDKRHHNQPSPVGRMFGNIYGADIKDWPLY